MNDLLSDLLPVVGSIAAAVVVVRMIERVTAQPLDSDSIPCAVPNCPHDSTKRKPVSAEHALDTFGSMWSLWSLPKRYQTKQPKKGAPHYCERHYRRAVEILDTGHAMLRAENAAHLMRQSSVIEELAEELDRKLAQEDQATAAKLVERYGAQVVPARNQLPQQTETDTHSLPAMTSGMKEGVG